MLAQRFFFLLIRITLPLILTCAGSIGISRLVGRAQPVPNDVLFTNPDGTPCESPCLFGIQPGQTPYRGAVALLQTHAFTHCFTANLEGDILGDDTMAVMLQSDSESEIAYIELWSRAEEAPIAEAASLGQLLYTLGTPDLVQNNGATIRLYYFGRRLMLNYRHRVPYRIDATDAFDSLIVYAKPPEVPSDGLPWRGLRRS